MWPLRTTSYWLNGTALHNTCVELIGLYGNMCLVYECVCLSLYIYIYIIHLSYLSVFKQQSACLCLVYSYTNSLVAPSWPSVITRHHANPPLSPVQASEWLVGSQKHSPLPTWRKQTAHSYTHTHTQNTSKANTVHHIRTSLWHR